MIILVGESASGKSSIEKALIEKYKYKSVISYTTRPSRNGEVDGIDYHFISDDEFIEKFNNGFFTESGAYNGWFYGSIIDDYSNDSVTVLTPHGMREIKKNIIDIPFTIFYIKVPRRDRLIKSLERCDGTDNAVEECKRRDSSDLGQYDGIEDEVDFVIENPNYNLSPAELADKIVSYL